LSADNVAFCNMQVLHPIHSRSSASMQPRHTVRPVHKKGVRENFLHPLQPACQTNYLVITSTRLFRRRPSLVSLDATGLPSPIPIGFKLDADTP